MDTNTVTRSRTGAPVGRRRPRLVVGVALGLLSLLLSACAGGGGSSASGSGTTTLKYQDIYAPGNAFADAAKAYGDAVTQEASGSVQFEYFWSNSVAPTDGLAAAMDSGLLDMGRVQPPANPAAFPTMSWLSQASFLNSSSFPAGLLQKIGAHLEFALNNEQIASEVNALGIRYIAPLATVQQYDLFCKNPVRSLADMQGLKIRVAGESWAKVAKKLGAEPVQISAEEIYQAYQRGIVDCVMTYPTHYVQSGLRELGGYYVPLQFNGWNQGGLVISKSAWEDLDKQEQKAMYRGVRAWLESFVSDQLKYYWQFAAKAEQYDVTLGEPLPKVQRQIDQYHQKVLPEMASSAPKGVEDPEALLTEYQKLHEKWRGIVEELGYETGYSGLQGYLDSLKDPSTPPEIDLDPWLDKIMKVALREQLGS